MKRFLVAFTFALLMLCLSGTAALAQSSSAVTGIVTDPTGAVANGADVKSANPKIGFEQDTKTNDQGCTSSPRCRQGRATTLTFTAGLLNHFFKLVDCPLGDSQP